MTARLSPPAEVEVALPAPGRAEASIWGAAPDGAGADLSSAEIEDLLTSDLNSRCEIGMGAPL